MNNPYLPLNRFYKEDLYKQWKEENKTDTYFNFVQKELQIKKMFKPASNYNWDNVTRKIGNEYKEYNMIPYSFIDKGFHEYWDNYKKHYVGGYNRYQIDFNDYANRRRGVSAGERKCKDMDLYFKNCNKGVSKYKNINNNISKDNYSHYQQRTQTEINISKEYKDYINNTKHKFTPHHYKNINTKYNNNNNTNNIHNRPPLPHYPPYKYSSISKIAENNILQVNPCKHTYL